jgi:hypothetical protein
MNEVTTIGLGRPFLAKPLSPAQRSRSQHQAEWPWSGGIVTPQRSPRGDRSDE